MPSELGTTVIITTHYMDEAATLCNLVAFLRDGEIVASGTLGALVAAAGAGATLDDVFMKVTKRDPVQAA
jgi:ABC-2 type transport system ATP-binding protein